MNSAHLHLMLVHIPIVLMPLGLILLVIKNWKNREYSKTALSIFIAAAIFGIVAFLLGEGAEDIVEDSPGIVESLIESHEDAATVSLWLTVAVGVFSLGTLLALQFNKKIPKIVMPIILVLSVLSTVSLAYTAQEGGKIRHPEAYPKDLLMDASKTGEAEDDSRTINN